ncbi:TonB-dependent receptor [Hephaestia mangrovi]|uniref:TonB-dependent receptor n=1 Tax=Hephaestia mangrovi TaxID=2873268 RepID=UPI001CA7A9BC|nr:TonB-dependent receptor [Hephaestia mangrovi]MBY8827029.1 TonB-dependent receptor [Hephaestia mangrovi]
MNSDIENKIGDRIRSRRIDCRRLAGATSLIALAVAAPAWARPLQVSVNTAADAAGSVSQDQTSGQSGPAAPAAQQVALPSDQDQSNDIIVTGIIGSLQRNLDAKREAPGVVDVISSEDIGKFPDSNVAASLQRLPGVSIQRSGVRGEANGITVRGFGGDFNTTLIDGRQISSATGGRSIDFTTVGSEFIGSLQLLKTPDVSLSSSSIGATLNVAYPKPMDRPGFHAAVSAAGSLQGYAGKITPVVGGLVSDTFANDTIGVLADVIYTRHDTQTNNVYVHGWPGGYYAPCQLAGSTATTCSPTSNPDDDAYADPNNRQTVVGWYEQQYGAQQSYTRDERVDARLALQWRPADNLLFTLDDNYSNQKIRTETFGFGIWFNQGNMRNVVLDDNGTTTDFTQPNSQTDFTAATDRTYQRSNQVGLNMKWDIGDHLHVEADGAYSKSELDPDGRYSTTDADVGYGGVGIGPALGISIKGNSNDTIPVLHDYGAFGDPSRWSDESVIGSHVAVDQAPRNSDTLKQFRLSAEWKQDDFSLKIGGSYVDDSFHLKMYDTFTNNFWQAYSGYGPASGGGGVSIPSDLFHGKVSTDNFIPGFSGALPPDLIRLSGPEYQAYLSSLGDPYQQNIPGFNYPASDDKGNGLNNFHGTFDVQLSPSSVQHITEKTWAGYVRANFVTDIGSMRFHFNAGAREEITQVRSSGLGQVPTSIALNKDDPTLLTVSFSPDVEPVTTESNYSYLLPSLDMKLDITDRLDVRFDASRTLTRPALNFLNPVLSVPVGPRIGALTASGGSPRLKPYLADNFDLAAEWFYARNSYASVDFFLKSVNNFIVQGTQRQSINDLIDPSTGTLAQFAVSQRVNGPKATVRGVELAWQQVFGNSGFGFNANATFVNTNKPYDNTDISQSGFAVTGLANSANFVGFYDKNGLEARVAVNWRDEYLLQFGQTQNTGQFGSEPTFVNASTQVDFSTSYQLTKAVNIFFDMTNIFNETQSTHGRFKNQLLDVYGYGRRITAGVRYHF